MQIELVFLGTSGAIPTKERNCSAIYGKTKKNTFLLDCGEGTQKQLLSYNLDFFVDWIVITHYHLDHFGGFLPYLSTQKLLGRTKPLKVFTPKTEYIVEIGLAHKADFWSSLGYDVEFVEICESKKHTQNDDLLLEFIQVSHGIKCYGVQIKSLNNTTYDKEKLLSWGSEEEIRTLIKEGAYIKEKKSWSSKDFVKNNDVYYDIMYSGDTIVTTKLLQRYLSSKNCILIHECTYFFKEDETLSKKNNHTHLNFLIDKIVETQTPLKEHEFASGACRKLVLTHFGNKISTKILNNSSENFLKFFKKKDALKVNLHNRLVLARDGLKLNINNKKNLFTSNYL